MGSEPRRAVERRYPPPPRTATARSRAAKDVIHRLTALDWDRISLAGTLTIGLVFALAMALGQIDQAYDFTFYWRATDFNQLYPADRMSWITTGSGYVYPPVLAQLLYPFHVLPFGVALVGWLALCLVAMWYCLRELSLLFAILGLVALTQGYDHPFGWVLGSALAGNIQLPMAAAIVLGMRHSGWFVIPILAKLTTGVGLLWYAFRGEWRRFGTALLLLVLVVSVSFAIAPKAWFDWAQFSIANFNVREGSPPIVGPPLVVRATAAALLVLWGARTNRPWVVAVAGGVAIPGFYGFSSLVTVSVGAWALSRRSRNEAATVTEVTSRTESMRPASGDVG